jgi:L-asparagine oxygenase
LNKDLTNSIRAWFVPATFSRTAILSKCGGGIDGGLLDLACHTDKRLSETGHQFVLVELSPEQVLNSVPQICGEDPCAAPQASADRFAGILAGQLGQNVTTPLSLFQTGAFPWICLRTKFVPDGLPTTPISWEPSPAMAWWPLASMACGFMRIAGLQPVSYRSENDGHAFVNLTVRPDDPNDRAGVAKSRGQLRGHTDAVAFPFAHEFELGERDASPAPDALVLVALRNPERVPTKVASISNVIERLSPTEQAALRSPVFLIRAQESFQLARNVTDRALLADDPRSGMVMRFSHSAVSVDRRAYPQQFAALEKFKSLLAEQYVEVSLEPGDILIVNNRTAIHGRAPVGDDFAGTSRWLLRTYGHWLTTTALYEENDRKHILLP